MRLCERKSRQFESPSVPGRMRSFSVRNDAVANQINAAMGKRVTLHYEEKVGLPTSCFGETRHFVTRVTEVSDIPLAPGLNIPVPVPPVAPSPT